MRLSDELKNEIFALASQLLDVIDFAGSIERTLFEQHGQSDLTLNDLQALSNVSDDAQDLYRRLSGLMAGIARDDIQTATAKMNLLRQSATSGSNRIAAFLQSIREVQQFWRLS
ncbi:hypothetical protein [Gloeobacter kilaueensis]|uniref:Uncharacterized protein n=1 Tax=Gloeobacter kilaueensis (strain ATCC BAA-2537 / CCAP 1431/1 / ULC 316 / JS1) TaxID=1183438 RepID=U5QLA9_GLOK1|nr:hypothetical protein [Gloeobacter kilaueensis]AGY58450.1 hypothetical protein GKIL_2204 [Gloeobacter kilaueensis JS1]